MTTPIIDPSTLTEEQRKEVKQEYNLNIKWEGFSNSEIEKHWYYGRNLTLLWLFGEEFFEEGE